MINRDLAPETSYRMFRGQVATLALVGGQDEILGAVQLVFEGVGGRVVAGFESGIGSDSKRITIR
jgi:hypothetical protein